jgi:hypothetical protein
MGAREIILTHETTYDASTLPKLWEQQFRVCGTMGPVARSEKPYPRNLHDPYDKAESSRRRRARMPGRVSREG